MSTLLFFGLVAQATKETNSRLLREALRLEADLPEVRRRKIAGTISGELIEASKMEKQPEGLLKSAGASEVHYNSNCQLGYGYDLFKQACISSVAIKIPGECTPEDDLYVNCQDKNTQTSGGWTSYNMKTTSSDDYSSLISSAVSAEGSGWGVSVSVSADYMQSHAVTSNSVGFWVGASGDVYNTFMRNPTELQLNDAAKITLEKDWKSFISNYGTHYVKQIVHSTNFIGSAQITSTSEATSSDLSVAAEMSYDGFFSASGSAEYSEATQGSSGSLKVKVTSKYRGQLIPYSDDDSKNAAEQLAEDFQTWTKNVNDDPEGNSAPTRLVYRTLYDLAEVQKIVVDNYPVEEWAEIAETFTNGLPTTTTLSTISEEAVWTDAQKNTLTMYRTYDCVKENDGLMAQVNEQRDILTSHMVDLESMDGPDIMLREAEILAGDFSWFFSRDMGTTKMIEEQLLETCPKDECHCTEPGNWLNKEISCTVSGKSSCDKVSTCWTDEVVEKKDIDELCTTDWCLCDISGQSTPVEGYNNRRIYCAEAPWRECKVGKECLFTGIWKYGDWENLCFST